MFVKAFTEATVHAQKSKKKLTLSWNSSVIMEVLCLSLNKYLL